MTFQISPKTLVKITSSQLDGIQATLMKTGYSLDEILEYDNGTVYECWSNWDSGTSITLDITSNDAPCMDHVVAEIIDCWLELRAIRNLLTAVDEQPALPDRSTPEVWRHFP